MGLEFNMSKLATEFFGTAALVLCGSGVAAFYDSHNFINYGLITGLTSYLLIQMFGHVSGGHFNPTLTLGAAMSSKFGWGEAIGYVICQLLGGILGGLGIFLFIDGGVAQPTTHMPYNSYVTGEYSFGFKLLAVLLAELVFGILFTIAALSKYEKAFDGVTTAVAYSIFLTILVPFSRGSLSAARSLGVAVFSPSEALEKVWLFIVVPSVAGLIGGLLARFVVKANAGAVTNSN